MTEYGLGLDVFGKPPDFDPRIDTIVRVEMNRLRQRLREYYGSVGAADPVIIEIPLRSYLPTFSAVPAVKASVPAAHARPPRRYWWVAAIAVLTIAAGLERFHEGLRQLATQVDLAQAPAQVKGQLQDLISREVGPALNDLQATLGAASLDFFKKLAAKEPIAAGIGVVIAALHGSPFDIAAAQKRGLSNSYSQAPLFFCPQIPPGRPISSLAPSFRLRLPVHRNSLSRSSQGQLGSRTCRGQDHCTRFPH